MTGRYKKPSKIHTNTPKRLKYGLKRSQEDTLHDPGCPQTIFFQNWGVGPSIFAYWSKMVPGRYKKQQFGGPYTKFLEKKLSEDILHLSLIHI